MHQHKIPWLSATNPESNYVFQQDSPAPAPTTNLTQRFLKNNLAAQWSKEVWLPYSLDVNLLDYGIWDVLHTKVNANSHENTKSW
jgi:hypothetical protein